MINPICSREFCDTFSNQNFYIGGKPAEMICLVSHITRGQPSSWPTLCLTCSSPWKNQSFLHGTCFMVPETKI